MIVDEEKKKELRFSLNARRVLKCRVLTQYTLYADMAVWVAGPYSLVVQANGETACTSTSPLSFQTVSFPFMVSSNLVQNLSASSPSRRATWLSVFTLSPSPWGVSQRVHRTLWSSPMGVSKSFCTEGLSKMSFQTYSRNRGWVSVLASMISSCSCCSQFVAAVQMRGLLSENV